MPKNIVWLASYPKSGNTWLRLFLLNYLFNPETPAPINQAHRIGSGDAVSMLYRKISKKPVNLKDVDVSLSLRSHVIKAHASNGADVNFMKTHNSNLRVRGRHLVPKEFTKSAIYVIRNPLDMLVSFAHHYNSDAAEIAEAINSPSHVIEPDDSVVHQFIGNWSEHVMSWTKAKNFKTHVIRYEDMHGTPDDAFGNALKFIGAPSEPERLKKAIRFSNFDESKKQERQVGFAERSVHGKDFFRSGKLGEGLEVLPKAIVDKVIADHGPVMREFGYLD